MTTATRTKKRAKPTVEQFSVDYPPQGATISSPQYAVRVSAPEDARGVEVSVDQGAWRPCRKAAGHWWYDWSGYDDGEYEIIARLETADGRRMLCEPHEFHVEQAVC